VPPTTPTLPLLEAANRAGVDVAQIRRWAAVGVLDIHRRGGMEVVLVDQVMTAAASARRRDHSSGRDTLRARLADARVQNASVMDLQQAARDRTDRAR
jgi:hypothetical protein